jgi:hypothetical protein
MRLAQRLLKSPAALDLDGEQDDQGEYRERDEPRPE